MALGNRSESLFPAPGDEQEEKGRLFGDASPLVSGQEGVKAKLPKPAGTPGTAGVPGLPRHPAQEEDVACI